MPRTVKPSAHAARNYRRRAVGTAPAATAELMNSLGFPTEYLPVPVFTAGPQTRAKGSPGAPLAGLHGVALPQRYVAPQASADAPEPPHFEAFRRAAKPVRPLPALPRRGPNLAASPDAPNVAGVMARVRDFGLASNFAQRVGLAASFVQRFGHLGNFARGRNLTLTIPRVQVRRPVIHVNVHPFQRFALALGGLAVMAAVVVGLGFAYVALERAHAQNQMLAQRTAAAAARIADLEVQAAHSNVSLQALEAQDGRLKALLAESIAARDSAQASAQSEQDQRTALIDEYRQELARTNARLERSVRQTRRPKPVVHKLASADLSPQLAAIPAIDPTAGGELTSNFGWRSQPWPEFHRGLDLAEPVGHPVQASADGVVVEADWNGGFGEFVDIDHGNGYQTYYGHLSRIDVHVGQHVRQTEVIGAVGQTGDATGPHLHYQLMRNGTAIDPTPFMHGIPASAIAGR